MTDTTQKWWENEAWKNLKRVKELELENAQLRERLLTEQQTRKVTCSRCGLWVAIRGHVCVEPVEIVELARPIGSTDDEPSTWAGLPLNAEVKWGTPVDRSEIKPPYPVWCPACETVHPAPRSR